VLGFEAFIPQLAPITTAHPIGCAICPLNISLDAHSCSVPSAEEKHIRPHLLYGVPSNEEDKHFDQPISFLVLDFDFASRFMLTRADV
jgi:hypothetical protein